MLQHETERKEDGKERIGMGVDFAEKSARIMVYTRKTDERLYPDGLARSIHLAYSRDGENYEAMNGNYGILFAEGTLDKNDTICPKGVEAPRVFPMPGGGFGITAFRVNENGSADEESEGRLLLWTTDDFIAFREMGFADPRAAAGRRPGGKYGGGKPQPVRQGGPSLEQAFFRCRACAG